MITCMYICMYLAFNLTLDRVAVKIYVGIVLRRKDGLYVGVGLFDGIYK